MKKSLAIIMPVYNEEEIIEHVVANWTNEIDKLGIDYDLHLYNDGSKDNTQNVLEKLNKKYSVIIIHNKKNSGHGPTILKGYNDLKDSYEWIFQTDSDNELPPEYFKILWNKKETYDFLIGIRDNRIQPSVRKIVSIISRFTVWLFYSKSVYDVNSPYRLMRVEKFREIYQNIPEITFAPNIILAGYAGLRRFRIFQYPIQHCNRKTGTVSIKKVKLLKAAIKSYLQTIRFRFVYLKNSHNK